MADMTAKDKAQAGLWMIEEAIQQHLRENGPRHPAEVADALGLRWKSPAGEQLGGIATNLMKEMVADGRLVTTDPGPKPAYDVAPESTN
jgi:hypothetical protein